MANLKSISERFTYFKDLIYYYFMKGLYYLYMPTIIFLGILLLLNLIIYSLFSFQNFPMERNEPSFLRWPTTSWIYLSHKNGEKDLRIKFPLCTFSRSCLYEENMCSFIRSFMTCAQQVCIYQ